MYQVYFYKTPNGDQPVLDYLTDLLSKKDKDSRIKANKINDYIQILSEYGTRAGEPYMKHIDGEIWELRPLRDRIFFVAWVKSLTNCLSVDAWAKLGIVFFILLLISFSLFFFSKQIIWKKSGFIAGILFLVFTVLSNIFASEQKSELLDRNDAIVLSPSVTVRSTPSESGTGLFVLHEGHKIEIKDNSMREWKEIRLEDGKVGWIPASAIEVI